MNYKLNSDKRKTQIKKYALLNKDKIALTKKKYQEVNKEHIANYQKEYRDLNKAKLQEYIRKYQARRMVEDPEYRLRRVLRSRLHHAITGIVKQGSAVSDLGCSISELKDMLEDMFYPKKDGTPMTWSNYGEWHIDHLQPLSSFNLADRSELKVACHHSNLQPLWASDNIRKGSK